jgi:hypothetical protein
MCAARYLPFLRLSPSPVISPSGVVEGGWMEMFLLGGGI